MADQNAVLALYALALSLVDDADVAGDLFLAARDEAHLRRLAARWRRQNRLPEPDGAVIAELNDEQKEHGLYLAGRRNRRQKLRRTLPLAAGLALLAVAALSLVRWQHVDPLLEDPVWTGAPVVTETAPNGVQFDVYRAEATPGAVTVWWTVSGPGAEQAGIPTLYRLGRSVMANRVEKSRNRSGRQYGKATYTLITAGTTRVGLTLPDRRGEDLAFAAPVLERVDDPAARVVQVDQLISGEGTITQIILGDTYTVLVFQGSASFTDLQVMVGTTELRASGELTALRPVGEPQRFVYGPVPPGTRSLKIVPLGSRFGTTMRMPVDQQWVRLEVGPGEVRGVMEMPGNFSVVGSEAIFIDRGQRRYVGTAVAQGGQAGRYTVHSTAVPSGAEVVAIEVRATEEKPWQAVTVELTN